MLATMEFRGILFSANWKPSVASLVPLLSGEGVEKWPRAFSLPKSVIFVVF